MIGVLTLLASLWRKFPEAVPIIGELIRKLIDSDNTHDAVERARRASLAATARKLIRIRK